MRLLKDRNQGESKEEALLFELTERDIVTKSEMNDCFSSYVP